MLANEMRNIARDSRDTNIEFMKKWEEMKDRIRETAREGKNYCIMIRGKYDEQLIQKLENEGFKVMTKMELFPQVHYGMTGCLTKYVVW